MEAGVQTQEAGASSKEAPLRNSATELEAGMCVSKTISVFLPTGQVFDDSKLFNC